MERTKAAVLGAARHLLFSEGPGALTPGRVAKEARVGRATLYRHWPQPDDLLIDLLSSMAAPSAPIDPTRPALEQLQEQLQAANAALWGEMGSVFAALVGRAEWDARIEALKQRVVAWIASGPVSLVRLGTELGEFTPRVQPDAVVSALIGAMFARRFITGERLSEADLDALLGALLNPLAKR